MKFTDRPKWKRILLAVICLIGLLAAAGGSFAAYTSQAFQRGVARNRDTETIRFTSNYMQSCALGTAPASYSGRTVLFSESEKNNSSLSIDLYVYNYANGNTNLVSQKDITYDLKVTFKGGSGTGSQYKVDQSDEAVSSGAKADATGSESSVFTYTISNKTLTGRAANFHKYTLTFPGSDLDKLKITAVATPRNVSVTNNQILAAVIAPCTGSTTQTFSYEGKFIDESSSTTPAEYMGFNYEVSISSGTANATLKWDSSVVEIDKFFLENNNLTATSSTGTGENWLEVTFPMDQSKGTGDYLIPFYIADKDNIPDSWAGMKNMITFSAEQTQDQT